MENNESTQSKYDAALAKYNTNLNDAEVAAEVAGIIAEKVPANNTPEVKKFLFNCIDLTTLNSTDSDESVMKFTQKVNQFDEEFPDLKNVAAICVYPNFAEVVKDTLEVEDVKIACVSAGFPSSQTFIEVKVAETAMAIMEGADEIDIVISVGKFLSGDYETMCDEIQELKATCKEHHLKVILETGALKTAANSGMVMTPAQKRGAKMRRTGSTAIISIALNCSPARISPISAVSDVPARPANNSAVTTGPSSRTRLKATSRPSASDEPYRCSV